MKINARPLTYWVILAAIAVLSIGILFSWATPDAVTKAQSRDSAFFIARQVQLVEKASDWIEVFDAARSAFGWRELFTAIPQIVIYVLFGLGAIQTQASITITLVANLTLVYLIARTYTNHGTALISVSIFGTSSWLAKYLMSFASPFSSLTISLAAIYFATAAELEKEEKTRSLVLWFACGFFCLINIFLVDYGLWVVWFLASVFWLPRLTRARKFTLLGAFVLSWVIFGFSPLQSGQVDLLGVTTPLRTILSSPAAVLPGSSILAAHAPFSLPGHSLLLTFALLGYMTIVGQNPDAVSFTTAWLLAISIYSFWFIAAGESEILLLLLPPLAIFGAVFFEKLAQQPKVLFASLIPILIFALFLAMEPAPQAINLDATYSGWATPTPVFDLSQVARGLLFPLAIISPWMSKTLSKKGYSIYLGVLFVMFLSSEFGLTSLL